MEEKFKHILREIPQNPYFPKKNHANSSFILYKGNSVELMKHIPRNSIDLIFADPPYRLSKGGITCHAGRMVSVNKGKWDISKGAKEDHEFNIKWLRECQRILSDSGTIWVSGTAHIIHSIGYAMQELNFKLLNDIVWYKINPPPNLACRYFTHSTETIIWAAKSPKSKHIFKYKEMKAVTGKQMKNVWQDLLFWAITPPKKAEKKYGKHPTQKPVQLLERIILASSEKGDVVLDPFSGSGTTGIAAYRLKRKYIGLDLEKNYLDLTIKRYEDEIS
ncbi:DNA-methyltransferase [Candidatus Omnitrophota bacterium]